MGKVLIILSLFLCISSGYTNDNLFVKLDQNSNFSLDTAGVPIKALPAIKYSFAILDSVLTTNVPIRVKINFSATSRKEVIATGAATSYEIGFSDLASPNFFYPISLAEKISGTEINGSNKADISVVINQKLDWNYEADIQNIGKKFDFITLFTHELVHGLGFQSLVQVRSSAVDTSVKLSIFDSFLTDSSGVPFYPDYYSRSPEDAYSLITNSALFFTTNYFKSLFLKSRISLYAEKPYASGNSIHHLNYQKDSIPPFRLMRPGFRLGEHQRYLDPSTRSILHAIGWNRPNILHNKQFDVDTVTAGQTLVFSNISTLSDFTIEYSLDQFKHFKSIDPECINDTCFVHVPPLEFAHIVNYRLKYNDKIFGSVILPCETCSIGYFVGEDTVKPHLSNIHISTIFADSKQVLIKYQVSDNSGPVDVYLAFYLNNKAIDTIKLSYKQGQYDNYLYTLPILSENDKLQFSLTAIDYAKRQNSVTVIKSTQVLPLGDICNSYSTDFEDAESDFLLNGFSIVQNAGFNTKSLDSKHPYIAPNKDQDTLFTYALLKPRIILDSIHYLMSFDEIVFVEPCEVGKQFGEFGFWDFVSVEGSKDNGKTWHIFGKVGYDATYNNDWYESYLSSIVVKDRNKNSLSVPTEDMYRKHVLNLVENKYLQKGDTVMIRFVLTSDAFSTGWGWSIDNLVIQEGAGVTSSIVDDEIIIYPNPFSNEILFSENIVGASFQIISILGERLLSGIIHGKSLDTKCLPDGVYLIIITKNGVTYSKSVAKLAD